MWKLSTLNPWQKRDEAAAPPAAAESDVKQSRRPVPGLQREQTFQRRQSERRVNLEPNEPDVDERRALSADRGSRPAPGFAQLRATSSVPSEHPHHYSNFSPLPLIDTSLGQLRKPLQDAAYIQETLHAGVQFDPKSQYPQELPSDLDDTSDASDDLRIQEEIPNKWVLNLSMHFRDKSDREKFFNTYLRQPNEWIRVTVSCDYRSYQPDSLEAELKKLFYQRDKSGKIYEAIHDSLPEIQFFPTVTNLKLQTEDGRLHVHVTEDANEVIQYPSLSLLPYLDCPQYPESEVFFHSHESGFVYDVSIHGKRYIKKEIPGPEAVEEFLYEINALSSLRDSPHVIPFEGLVVDETREHVRGIVLGFAANGALVDILYDHKDIGSIPWPQRLKWATQIADGLADIHEAGFVQGDFTLSNIVVDEDDNALIIDINRRGCPVGWEPPELSRMIEAGQKISIYIGVKTDIYQLAMVLWALADQHDEPERATPLKRKAWKDVPQWYADVFERCYQDKPQDRPTAKEVSTIFRDRQRQDEQAATGTALSTSAGFGVRDAGSSDRASSSAARPEVSHPASWHVPAHQDSGFDETQGGAEEDHGCSATSQFGPGVG